MKRKAREPQVQWSGGSLGADKLKTILERAVGPVGTITTQKGSFLVEMAKPQADKLLGMGVKVDGVQIQLDLVRKRLSATDIFEWLQEEMRTREESKMIAENVSKIRGVQSQPPTFAPKEGSGPLYHGRGKGHAHGGDMHKPAVLLGNAKFKGGPRDLGGGRGVGAPPTSIQT